MSGYITQAYTYFTNALEFLNDSRDFFEAGDIVEVKEIIEYKDVETPKLPAELIEPTELTEELIEPTELTEELVQNLKPQKKQSRTKPIVTGKYSKQKGEKVGEWRKRIIPKYNELKNVKYNAESKYYSTPVLNNFIKEIEEIEAKSNQDNQDNNENDSKKERYREDKTVLYKKFESGENTNHPKTIMRWLTKAEYNDLREIYRAREYKNYRKSGYYKNKSDEKIWEFLDMQDPDLRSYNIELGEELKIHGI